jgi:ankyrin repeat protein
MFAAFYSNIDAIELLAASDANFQLIDKFNRSCLHYAVQQDNSKLIQTVFLSCKGNQRAVT